MRTLTRIGLLSVVGITAVALLAGCASTGDKGGMASASAKDENVVGCAKCYDVVKVVHDSDTRGVGAGPGKVIKTHQCPDCKTDMSVYTSADGTLMFKCAGCAAKGIPCDKCKPPKGKS